MNALPISEVLSRAADLIEPEGKWIQHRLEKMSPESGAPTCFCAMGALIHVGRNYGFEAISFVEQGLPPTKPGQLAPLPAWNDHPSRTQAEVVAKLREAAALAKEQGK